MALGVVGMLVTGWRGIRWGKQSSEAKLPSPGVNVSGVNDTTLVFLY